MRSMIYAEANGGGGPCIIAGIDTVDAAAANLMRISSKSWRKAPEVMCVICGMSRAAYRREDGVYAMPVIVLRERCSREHY